MKIISPCREHAPRLPRSWWAQHVIPHCTHILSPHYKTSSYAILAIATCTIIILLIIILYQVTTDVNGECRDDFGGTSSAAPLVAGVIALALQAKYASIQHNAQGCIA